MGALHAGHAALIDQARSESATVVVSVFVNPLQFGPSEDLASYPRTLDDDLEVCAKHGAEIVWAPSVLDVYPDGPARIRPDPGEVGALLEGASRPGHFAGMLTVVAKLFGLVHPDLAYFGEKDYQQLVLIRQLVRDLELGPAIVGVPTVRDPDGLALSSRNTYLSPEQRSHALALSRALFAGRAAAGDGPLAVITAATSVLAAEPDVHPDYLELRSADLSEIPEHGPARLLVAARVFELVSEGRARTEFGSSDGARVSAGEVLMTVRGPLRDLLIAERTALNLLGHLSGVATLTRQWVDAVAGTGARIRDTRKTMPGLRALEKYAVRCGGGVNHRMSLSDAALVKDNHVAAAGGIVEAFAAVRARYPGLPLEVEADTVEQARAVIDAGAELVLLDNMAPADLRTVVAYAAGRAELEASGGLQLHTAREIAETGVDYLAVGALTHSAPVLDIGLDL
jgi:nicotinate-nucleotide pyrophosphorylase/pantoate--beta-alanine ligase